MEEEGVKEDVKDGRETDKVRDTWVRHSSLFHGLDS